MRYIYLTLLAAILMSTGCNKDAQTIEEREERDPFVKSGQEFMDEQKWDQAIDSFKRALEKEPRMARPHLDLAIIYQQHKINYIHAIYHYDRYLELRPDAEKAEFIKQQKLKVAQALANTLINNSPEVKQVVKERNELLKQNKALQSQMSARGGGQSLAAGSRTASPSIASSPAPSTSSGKN
ncbi:MAG: tetratricopeptide repeat protein [Pontiella sp.]|nr:tetratricopeptide repeat protein [Pontiella sp.]